MLGRRVVGEAAINRCISRLRALAAPGDGTRYFNVETIARAIQLLWRGSKGTLWVWANIDAPQRWASYPMVHQVDSQGDHHVQALQLHDEAVLQSLL